MERKATICSRERGLIHIRCGDFRTVCMRILFPDKYRHFETYGDERERRGLLSSNYFSFALSIPGGGGLTFRQEGT